MLYEININNHEQSKIVLSQISVTQEGIELMADKLLHLNIKLKNIKLAAANILKQEMLSLGADAAVAKGVVIGKDELSDAVLSGSINQFRKLVCKLERQSWFGLSEIKTRINTIIQQYISDKKEIMHMRGRTFYSGNCYIMGILNITPDSFSDGNKYFETNIAIQRCLEMIDEGADIIDIGGESARPGSEPIGHEEEIKRILPVIQEIRRQSDIPISIDTYNSETARAAIDSGADIINDISALRLNHDLINVVKENIHVPIILMHMLGEPKTMQVNPYYDDVINEIMVFFEERINYCEQNGIDRQRLILDPGICFGKRLEDNLRILHHLSTFKSLGCPVMLGASRKSFINKLYQSKSDERLIGSLGTSALAYQQKMDFVRVHDVKEHKQLLTVLNSVEAHI